MQETIRRMRERRADGDRGFTLIELLVVVVIIGVLVAIAIPVYLNYRKGAANKSASSDVRGSVSAIEQFYTENGNVYPADRPATAIGADMDFPSATGVPQKATVSPGNQLQYNQYNTPAPANTAAFKICGWNTDGRVVYYYNSASGGSVKKSASATLAACVANTAE